MSKKYIYDNLLKIKGIDFYKEYHEIKDISDRDNLIQLQEKYLRNLLLHAYRNVQYYNRILKKIGIINNEAVDLSKFDKIPILTKRIMRSEEIASNDYKLRRWRYNSSGGSTGEPTRFIQDNDYYKWSDAASNYYYQNLLGIDEVHVKKIILWGSQRDISKGRIDLKTKIGHWLTNTVVLNSFRMTEKDMEKFIKVINSYKPDLIRGYTGALYELCRYAERKKIAMYTPKVVIGAAETLTDEMRQKIENLFGTKVYNFYGSRETASIAGECKEGLLHIFMFNNYVEILDANNNTSKDGEEGRVIVTNLHNYSMPFIRYEIGDMAIAGPKKCNCGNKLPTLKTVTGRIISHFVKEDGTVVPAEFFINLIGVAYKKGNINKFQVIQEDYKKIRILVVTEHGISEEDKKYIDNNIKLVMGNDCKITWDLVDDIPKTNSGKYLYTKSLVKR